MWSSLTVRSTTQHSTTTTYVHSHITCLFLSPHQYELLAEMLNKHKPPQEEVEGVIQQYNNVSTHTSNLHITSLPASKLDSSCTTTLSLYHTQWAWTGFITSVGAANTCTFVHMYMQHRSSCLLHTQYVAVSSTRLHVDK